MKLNEAYPSRFLKADDLQGKDIAVTIKAVTLEEFDGDSKKEKKLIIAFANKQKLFVCNKTNASVIAKILNAPDTDDWIGKSIVIGPREVEFSGDIIWALRVSLKLPGQTAPAKPAAKPVSADNDGAIPEDDGSEIPF